LLLPGLKDVSAPLDGVERLCSQDLSYQFADCWHFLIAIAENHEGPWRGRFKFAWKIVQSLEYYFEAAKPIEQRALAVLTSWQTELSATHSGRKLPPSSPPPHEMQERAFDVEFARISALKYRAGNGDQAAARGCVTASDQLRRKGLKETTFFPSTMVDGTLGSCMRMAGELTGARKLLERTHAQAKKFDRHFYKELALVYLQTDWIGLLTSVLYDAGAISRTGLRPEGPNIHVDAWAAVRP
jgi:hypothetical protein